MLTTGFMLIYPSELKHCGTCGGSAGTLSNCDPPFQKKKRLLKLCKQWKNVDWSASTASYYPLLPLTVTPESEILSDVVPK